MISVMISGRISGMVRVVLLLEAREEPGGCGPGLWILKPPPPLELSRAMLTICLSSRIQHIMPSDQSTPQWVNRGEDRTLAKHDDEWHARYGRIRLDYNRMQHFWVGQGFLVLEKDASWSV